VKNIERKVTKLRMPEELHDRLKQRVKAEGKSMNEWLLEAIKEKLETSVDEQPQAMEPQLDLEIVNLVNKRMSLTRGQEMSKAAIIPDDCTPETVKTEHLYRDTIKTLERHFFDFDHFSIFSDESLEAMREKTGAAWPEYFVPALAMSPREQAQMYNEIRRRDLWEKCRDNPEERVYQDITREDIFENFELEEPCSIIDVANYFGLDYMRAHKYITLDETRRLQLRASR
jgi:hypothetical protein